MVDAFQLLSTRRSPHILTLTGPAPTKEQQEALLTVAARVPDHGKLTPWRFITASGVEGVGKLKAIIKAAYVEANPEASAEDIAKQLEKYGHNALVVIVVFSPKESAKIPHIEQQMSAGAACMNLVNAAQSMGYGSVWLTGWAAYDAHVRASLGIKDHETIAGLIHIGKAPTGREDRERPNLESIAQSV
jgi:nitroreductase